MVRKLICVAFLAGIAAWAARAGEPPAGEKGEKKDPCKNTFVGVNNCKLCHKDETAQWKKTKHAEALKTLQGPEAKEIAKKQGIADPAKDAKCLKCHVTAAECPADKKAKSFKETDAVGCESCHGAGKEYYKEEIMKDKEAAIAKGLVIPTEKVCVKCHNKESPTFKGFDYKEMVKKVEHKKKK